VGEGAAVLLGLTAALSWGTNDFLIRFAGRDEGPFRTMLFGQLAGLLVLTAWLLLDGQAVLALAGRAGALAWAAALLAVPANLLATFAFFRAITRGTVALVSSIAASYGAVTALLSIAFGERIALLGAVGIGSAVFGVALAASGHDGARTGAPRGVGLALLAAACYGIGFWLQGRFAVPQLGPLIPVWMYYAAGLPVLVAGGRLTRQSLALPRPGHRMLLLITGTLGVLAYLAFAAGLNTGRIAEVTVLSSLATGVTTMLARLILRERLAPRQWAGICAILAGILLIDLNG
jgi:drug/metabolite transporter (DMT)-like permease